MAMYSNFHQKDSDLDVCWIPVTLGYGPMLSTTEEMFLHAGKPSGRKFLHLGSLGWPYAKIEVLKFLSKALFWEKRNVYSLLKEYGESSNILTEKGWQGFDNGLAKGEKGIVDDLR